jgi:hypothetical protein
MTQSTAQGYLGCVNNGIRERSTTDLLLVNLKGVAVGHIEL